MQGKVKLFKSFCICFYNIGLWENFHVYCLNKFASAYVKCIKYSLDFTNTVVLQICFCSWAYQALTRFCTMREFVLLIICTFLIGLIVLCLCHAGCDMTAYMQCFCTRVCFQVFSFLFSLFSLCFCFLCVFFLFYGSSWSDSNKERKERKITLKS